MFNHKHYVPILKTKAGERWAIDHLTLATRSELTPLFEIHAHKDKGNVEHAAEMCDSLASVWGTASALFIDTIWLHGASGDASIIEAVFEHARNIGLLAIPVVRISNDSDALDAIIDVMDQDGRGCMIRVPAADLAVTAQAINGVAQYLQIGKDQIHLLLDYRHHPMNLLVDVPLLPTINQWRTFSAASGSFPRSLAAWPINAWHMLPRHDWATWYAGVTGGAIARRPTFSDYTLKDPGAPAAGGSPSVTLKYTITDNWLVRIGRRFQAGFSPNMYAICADLIARPEYSGVGFSSGDHAINQVAQHAVGPGAPQQWLQWGMNHHLTFVVDQIQNDPAL